MGWYSRDSQPECFLIPDLHTVLVFLPMFEVSSVQRTLFEICQMGIL